MFEAISDGFNEVKKTIGEIRRFRILAIFLGSYLLFYDGLNTIGGMATALSAMPNIDTLVDYTVVYKSKKRDAWSFAKGDMKHVKVLVTKYTIPDNLKNRNYANDKDYRGEFKNWIESIWAEKDKKIEVLKF